MKWGKFHLLVYAISITSGWSSMFETTTMSYVFPAAECDLSLNLEDKGLLNAVTYIGKSKNTMNFALTCSINIPQTFSRAKANIFNRYIFASPLVWELQGVEIFTHVWKNIRDAKRTFWKFLGMISTGFFWGYLSDTLGRKKLLITGYFLDAMFVMLSATSQSFTMLMVSKFFGGFM